MVGMALPWMEAACKLISACSTSVEVLHNVVYHRLDTLGILNQDSHLGGAFRQIVTILLAQIVGDLLVRFVDSRFVDF